LVSKEKTSKEMICIDESADNHSFEYEVYKATNISNISGTGQKESLISILLDFNESAQR